MTSSCVIAVDVGGSTVKGSVIDESGRSHHCLSRPSRTGTEALIVLRGVLDALVDAAAASGRRVIGAGVVTPAPVDPRTGRIGFAANLGWRDINLRADLESHLKLPVAVDHDVSAAGAAEAQLGPARDVADFVFIPIGTGIAAAVVAAGRTVTGVGNVAGEIGHMPVHPFGERCTCGQRGCLEVYASGGGMSRRYRCLGGVEARSAEQVVALRAADPIAGRVWADAIEALALGATTITMMLDPALIVLGGGLARAGATLLDPLREALAEMLAWRSPPPLSLSALGSDGGRVGAGISAFRAAGAAETVAGWTLASVLSRTS